MFAEYFAFSIHRWSPVIIYNIWNQSWHWMNSQSYIVLGYVLQKFEIVVGCTTFGFFSKPGDAVYVPKDHIKWIAVSFRISLSVKKVRIKPAIAWRCLYVVVPHFARRHPKFKSGTSFCRSIFRCKEVDIKLSWMFLFGYVQLDNWHCHLYHWKWIN